MRVGDLLTGMKFKIPQHVANMIVVPITSEKENVDVSGEMILQIAKDSDYSRLTIENIDNKPVIVPQGVRFTTKGKGQDRAILSSTVIEPKSEKEIKVGCIAPSDSAHIRIGKRDFSFMPTKIRIPAIIKQHATSYEVLWKDIEKYMKESGIPGRAMEKFYEQFDKELQDFVAQFEPIGNQVGAVVLINNEVAGIEIYPNYLAWNNVWRMLIRDSYGADAVSLIREKKIVTYKPVVDLDKVENIEDLESEVQRVRTDFVTFVNSKVSPMLQDELQSTEREVSSDFKVYNLSGGNFIGQMVTKGEDIVYVSLLRSQGHPQVQPEEDMGDDDEDW